MEPVLNLSDAPGFGPYCPFTGRNLRPLSQRLARCALAGVLALGLLAHGLHHLGPHLGPAAALLCGGSAAVVLWVAWIDGRARVVALLLATAVSLASAAGAWTSSEPLHGEGLGGWTGGLLAELARADDALLQIAGTRSYPLLALALGLASLSLVISEAWNALRVRHLPKRLWFARYHPAFGRAYRPEEASFGCLGVLAVDRDPLFAEKLIFLQLAQGANGLRLGGVGASLLCEGGEPCLPLAAVTEAGWFWVEGPTCYLDAQLDPSDAEVRLFLRALHSAPTNRRPRLVASSVDALAVADWYESDEHLYAKTYRRTPARRLFGVLFDSRAELAHGDVPRFSTLLLVDGRARLERRPEEFLGHLRYDPREECFSFFLRQEGRDPLRVQLLRGRDQVIAVHGPKGWYHLLFTAFGGSDT